MVIGGFYPWFVASNSPPEQLKPIDGCGCEIYIDGADFTKLSTNKPWSIRCSHNQVVINYTPKNEKRNNL
jgi:hypothetical protein